MIKTCHKSKKKIGLSICDLKTFELHKKLNFDFYKLLSISINNYPLIEELRKKNKPIYISTGFKSKFKDIEKCIKAFKSKKNLTILHTPMTYNVSELNFPKIDYLRKRFKLNVGYSNHNNDINSLNVLSAYKPKVIFLYCKQLLKKNRSYPDNDHAIYINQLEEIKNNYLQCAKMHKKQNEGLVNEKIFKKIKI